MNQVRPRSTRRKGLWATLAIAALTGASAITFALPAISTADPEPVPSPATTPASSTPEAQPGQPTATPPPGDPNATPTPAAGDPNAGRITNAVGGFSFVLPAGWVESDASHLDYGSALLSKSLGQAPAPGQAPPVANDTRIVMGRLDQKLYASAEATNPKAAVRLGSDMGEFFMPYPGTRINQDTTPLTGANGLTGSASYYEVKFSDTSKPNGQIWTGVIGSAATGTGVPQRWFVVWLGTGNDPVDKAAAKALAESIQPATAPAGPSTAGPAAPPSTAGPAAPPSTAGPAAPTTPTAPAGPPPTEGQAPAGENTATPAPERSVPA